MEQSIIASKYTIPIYLSSTSFKWYEFSDKWWKFYFKSALFDQFVYFSKKGINYVVEVIDPLEVISDQPDIVNKDLDNISNSNFIVCYLGKRLTIGTLMELSYCVYKNYPLILIDKHKIHRNHPWIKYWVKYIADDEIDAVTLIKNIIWKN